jgi:ketosteroid isomerase-like protein
MSRSSMAALSELWRAYSEGRVERALELVDAECEITTLDGELTYSGHDGVRRWLDDVRHQWKTLMVSYDEVMEHHDGCVIATGRIAASSIDGGRTVEGQLVCVAEFRDGRLHRARAFLDRDEAMRYAAGLRGARS